jgi:arylsulfatase A-like enzyme
VRFRVSARGNPGHLVAAGLVLLAAWLSGGARTAAAPSHAPLSRYAVIMVLDGARPDYFNLARMPNLRWLVRHGTVYKQAFVGQMVADTPPSHATIGSGLFPKHDGILGFWWKDTSTDTMTRPTDTGPVEAGDLERVLTAHHASSIAAQVHAADPSAQVVSVAGHKCYAADAMGGPSANDILCALIYHDRWVAQAMGTHRPPPGAINNSHFDYPIPNPRSGFAPAVEQWNLGGENTWTMNYALWAFRRIHYPRVLMMNLGETDVLGHFARDPRVTMAALMRHYDADLGHLIAAYRAAGILDRTDFIVTADHGMSRVGGRIQFGDLKRAIRMAGARQVFIEADTAADIGISDMRQSRSVALNVARLGGTAIDATYYVTRQNGSLRFRAAYTRPGLSSRLRHAYATLVNTDAPDAGGDVIAVYAPHVTTGDRVANGYHWLAGHLGPQWDEQHIPLIIAGAGVRHGRTSTYPARLVDIAPTVERLLGVPVGQVDGHVLADALVSSTASERAQQARNGAALAPMVAAIRRRSGQAPLWYGARGTIVPLGAQPPCTRMLCRLAGDPVIPAAVGGTALVVLAVCAFWLLHRRDTILQS